MKIKIKIYGTKRNHYMLKMAMIALSIVVGCMMFKVGHVAADSCPGAATDGGHYVYFDFYSYDGAGNRINGAQVGEHRDNSPGYSVVQDCPNKAGSIMTVNNPSTGNTGLGGTNGAQVNSTGQITFGDNCFNSNPYITQQAPPGYTFDHATVTNGSTSITVNSTTDFVNQFGPSSPFFLNQWPGSNSTGTFTINLYYNKPPPH